MISSLTGKVTHIDEQGIELDVNGLGFEILCTSSLVSELKVGENRKIETYLQIKEDAHVLFGFAGRKEKVMFNKLTSISGIGPKMALSILSGTTPASLATAIAKGNVGALSSVKGVGKKTAERIILELKEKVISEDVELATKTSVVLLGPQVDAVFGLRALGLKQAEAEEIVKRVATPSMTAEEIIALALKGLKAK